MNEIENIKMNTQQDLSAVNFETAPETLEDWKIGDPLKRENFNSFLVWSFRASRGQPELQKLLFLWLERKYNFDYLNTVKTFVQKGGYSSALSEPERKAFMDAFKSVPAHVDIFSDDVSRVVDVLGDFDAEITPTEGEFFDFDKIDSLSDFVQAAKKYKDHKMGR